MGIGAGGIGLAENPQQSAQALADLYMARSIELLGAQQKSNEAALAALAELKTALSEFQNTLTGGQGALKQSATVSDPAAGSATVGKGAEPGSYTFYVEQLASAHQVAYDGLPEVAAENAGTLGIAQADGSQFDVDLASADTDGDGNLSVAEIARAINQAPDNQGAVSASVVTIDGQQRLMLSSGQTGEAGAITLDTSGVGDPALASALGAPPTELAAAQDAVFYLGGKDGVRIQQGSNTFTGIDGVAMTFTQAGGAPVTLTVATDTEGTKEAVQQFVDAYNTLMKLVDTLAASGGEGKVAGPFSGDAGVRALQQQLAEMLRGQVDGQRLMDYGFEVDRQGTLSLDNKKFDEMLAKNPDNLGTLLNNDENSVLGKMNSYLKTWTSASDGHIKRREDSSNAIGKMLAKKEDGLTTQYTRVYERYLGQFTRLQAVQAQMENTLALLSGLPSIGGGKS